MRNFKRNFKDALVILFIGYGILCVFVYLLNLGYKNITIGFIVGYIFLVIMKIGNNNKEIRDKEIRDIDK